MKYKIFFSFLPLFALPQVAYSAGGSAGFVDSLINSAQGKVSENAPNIGTMFINLNELWSLIHGVLPNIAFVLGFVVLFVTLKNAINFSKTSREGVKVSTIISGFIGSCVLIGLHKIIPQIGGELGVESTLTDLSLYSADTAELAKSVLGESSISQKVFLSIVRLIQLVGLFIIIKAVYALKDYGVRGAGGEMTFFKFALHLFPGIGLYYIVELSQMFVNTSQYGITG